MINNAIRIRFHANRIRFYRVFYGRPGRSPPVPVRGPGRPAGAPPRRRRPRRISFFFLFPPPPAPARSHARVHTTRRLSRGPGGRGPRASTAARELRGIFIRSAATLCLPCLRRRRLYISRALQNNKPSCSKKSVRVLFGKFGPLSYLHRLPCIFLFFSRGPRC